jgi:hypothetical protein
MNILPGLLSRSRSALKARAAPLIVATIVGSLAAPGVALASGASQGPPLGRSVVPGDPAALAAGPGGRLYLVDTTRQQILCYQPGLGFRVVAGSGQGGRSPDGTPALQAKLGLGWWSGLAVRGTTVYFSDGDLVREVSRRGLLSTVAGGGKVALGQRPVPAREADMLGEGPNGLAIGPGGELYIATADGVYRLGNDGRLYWVVGEGKPLPPNWGGVYSNPGIQNEFTNANHLAFDSHGDLFVAGGGGFGLYERTSTGQLRFVEVLRAQGGAPGSVAPAPDGTVVAAYGLGLQRLGPAGHPAPVRANWPSEVGRFHFFASDPGFGVGVAVGAEGQIYVDTDAGDTLPVQGLGEVLPTGQARWLWLAGENPASAV